MKTKITLFLIAFLAIQPSMNAMKKSTDKAGFQYEYADNDPSHSRIYTLKNGLTVYLSKNNDQPKIQTYVAVRAGSTSDPSDNTGLAHYLEHMMFKGTSQIGTLDWSKEKPLLDEISTLYEEHKVEKDPAKKIAIYKKIDSVSQEASKYAVANEYDKIISNLGATGTNAHTWLDETVYKNNIPSNELEKWLKLEEERFSELTLRLFHTELETVYEEFNRGQDDEGRLVNYEMMDALFPIHPYGQQTTIGQPEHLKNPSMVAIHKYFDMYYVPNNMAVVLVGDLDYEKTIQLVNEYFGKWKYKELPMKKMVSEKPIERVDKRVVKSQSAERVLLAFRSEGAWSKDAMYMRLVDYILSNSGAGLIDLNLNQKHKVQAAASFSLVAKHYGFHALVGIPKEGQSLEDVKKELLGQLEEVKKGNFDEWIIDAITNDLKLQRMKSWDQSDGVATTMYNSFIQKEDWDTTVKEIDEMSKATKVDIVKFANEFYKDNNYIQVNKEQGVNDKLVRVDKPQITPLTLNREENSQYYKEFMSVPDEELAPKFIDYKKLIKEDKVKGVPFYFIKNEMNDIGELYFTYNLGTDNDKELGLALSYLQFLGTDKLSKEELEKELYKLGVSYNIDVKNDMIVVSLMGLEEHLQEGLKLVEDLLANPKVDTEAYKEYVQMILKNRKDNKEDKGAILKALTTYARYGADNRMRNIIPGKELEALNPQVLVDKIKGLHDYKKEIFYYGKDKSLAEKMVKKYHNFGKGNDYPVAKEYKVQEPDNTVYFAPYDMVQAEFLSISKGKEFTVDRMPLARVFNEYFGSGLSSIVFQEIRESKSLAYSAYANYSFADKKGDDDYITSYIGTQANKLPQAVEAMRGLMEEMPELSIQFDNAKKGALKQIASQRITKSNIFWNYLALRKKGLSNDIREGVYNNIQKMSMNDLKAFFDTEIKNKAVNTALIGNKSNLDWEAVKKLGKVKELTINELFNY